MAKRRGLALDGVLLLDKPVGLSSNHALQRARRSMDAAKAGHTGTLDPFATGLLVCCMGRATKISGAMLNADKAYHATLQFGEETDSRSEEHTSELQSLMRTSYAAFCLKKKTQSKYPTTT